MCNCHYHYSKNNYPYWSWSVFLAASFPTTLFAFLSRSRNGLPTTWTNARGFALESAKPCSGFPALTFVSYGMCLWCTACRNKGLSAMPKARMPQRCRRLWCPRTEEPLGISGCWWYLMMGIQRMAMLIRNRMKSLCRHCQCQLTLRKASNIGPTVPHFWTYRNFALYSCTFEGMMLECVLMDLRIAFLHIMETWTRKTQTRCNKLKSEYGVMN